MTEIEKTCENCRYEFEDMEGAHCRHCINNATENFEPKDIVLTEQEIRANAIDEFADRLSKYLNVESATKYGNKDAEQQRNSYDTLMKYEIADAIDDIAEQMKAGGIE